MPKILFILQQTMTTNCSKKLTRHPTTETYFNSASRTMAKRKNFTNYPLRKEIPALKLRHARRATINFTTTIIKKKKIERTRGNTNFSTCRVSESGKISGIGGKDSPLKMHPTILGGKLTEAACEMNDS